MDVTFLLPEFPTFSEKHAELEGKTSTNSFLFSKLLGEKLTEENPRLPTAYTNFPFERFLPIKDVQSFPDFERIFMKKNEGSLGFRIGLSLIGEEEKEKIASLDDILLDEELQDFSVLDELLESDFLHSGQFSLENIKEVLPKYYSQLVNEGINLLRDVLEQSQISDSKHHLLNLLKQMSKISKLGDRLKISLQSILQSTHTSEANLQSHKLTEIEIKQLFERLVTAYNRRTTMELSGKYAIESKVDQKTLVQWLNSVIKDFETQRVHIQPENRTFHLGTPMTKVEQFLIHFQETEQGTSNTFQQQLLQKFEQAMQTTQFLRANQGPNQLIFHLKPENLGEMMVRLVKINGELTAKIIVTSEATRKALQSNLHQLKTLFSPHQVVIEKQDHIFLQQTDPKGEQREEHPQEQQSFEEEEKDQEENIRKEKISFKEILTEKG